MRATFRSLCLLVATSLVAPAVLAVPGDIDPAFGTGGRVMLDAGYSFREGNGIAVQADGKYLVSGQARGWGTFTSPLLRFNADNSLDTTYGQQGEALGLGNKTALRISGTSVMATETIYDLAFDSKGNPYRDVAITRYAANGFLDSTFGPALDGRTQTFNVSVVGGGGEQRLNAFTITPGTVKGVGGNLVAAGRADTLTSPNTNLLVVRFLPNGALDTSFGSQTVKGTATFTVPAAPASFQEIRGVDVDPANGNILVVGYQGSPHKNFYALLDVKGVLKASGTLGSFTTSECNAVTKTATRWLIACGGTSASGVRSAYLTALNLTATAVDTTFTTTSTPLGGTTDAWRAITVSSTGSVYATGTGGAGAGRLAAGAFSATGAVVTGFGTGGVYLVPELDPSSGAAIGLTATQVIATGIRGGPDSDIPVVVLSQTTGARTSVVYEQASSSTEFDAVRVMPDGKLIVGGVTGLGDTGNFVTSRLNAAGTLDPSYGIGGYSTVAIPNMDSFTGLRDMLVQPDGNVLVTGDFGGVAVGQSRIGVARLAASGTGDPAFNAAGTPGYNFVNSGAGSDFSRSVRVQADGKIIVGGNGTNGALGQQMAAARFNADGTRDSTYGSGGIAMTLIPSATTGRDLDLAPDGTAVMAGDGANALGAFEVRLARFTTTGQFDTTFGTSGLAVFAMPTGLSGPLVHKVFALPSGQILVVASVLSSTGAGAMVVRLNANGSLDTSYGGGNGWVYVETATGTSADANFSAAGLMPNGKLVAAGYSLTLTAGFVPTAVRFTADGFIDTSFGTAGVSYYVDTVGFTQVFGVTVAPDGGLYLSGGFEAGSERLGLVFKTVAEAAPAPVADLAITTTDGLGNVLTGASTTYTVTVTNNGPSSVTGAVLSDAAAAGLVKTAVACSATPGACVSAPTVAQLESGTFALPALAVGATYEITVTANVTAASGTSVSNVATIAAPSGTSDPTPGNNSATDTDAVDALPNFAITTTASPANGGTVSCTPNPVASGATSTCTATPAAGFTFSAFSGDCTGATCTLTNVLAAKNVTATFTPVTFAITTTASPANGGTVSCTPNPVASGATSTCTATPAAGFTFSAFSGDCVGATCTLTNVLAAKSVTATFTPVTFAITTAASPANGGTVSCTPNPVNQGGSSTCTATPAAGFTFSAFSGDCVGATCTLTNVLAAKSVTATFAPIIVVPTTFAITATASPVDGGTVTCTPNPVNQGGTSTCTATPAAGFSFSSFSGDCVGATCTLTNVQAAMTVTANFAPIPPVTFDITATASPVDGGTVTCTPNPVSEGGTSTCAATPAAGFTFSGFSGDCTGATCTLTNVLAAKSVTATFAPIIVAPNTFAITATASPANGGTVSCTPNPVNEGGTSTCTATPAAGFTFTGFSGDCVGATCTLTNVLTARTVTATFSAVTAVAVKPSHDFNGDGKSDILWQHTDGSVVQWLMNGAARTSNTTILGPGTGWSVAGTGDFNGDGKADILWQHTSGAVVMWLMDGAARVGNLTLLGAGTGWSVAGTGDFNGDGTTDILWQHTDGSVVQWLMNGGARISNTLLLGPGTGWSVARTGDFNGDGKSDILWQHTDGSVVQWLMNGAARTSNTTLLGAGTGWSVARTGDFNGDGKTDILWQHTNGSVVQQLMDGAARISNTTILGAGTGWSVARTGDFNGDGKADILWTHTSGQVVMHLMNGAAVISDTTLLGAGTGWSVSNANQ